MAGHIVGGVSTAFNADEHILLNNVIKDADGVPEESIRLEDSMAAAAVSSYC